MELAHLNAFNDDHRTHFSVPFFTAAQKGAEPPDFQLETTGGRIALDCVVFADQQQRRVRDLMDRLRMRLVGAASGRDFSGITGCQVALWFGERLDDNPPRRPDDQLIELIVDAIAACRVDRVAVNAFAKDSLANGFPKTIPNVLPSWRSPEGDVGFVVNVVSEPSGRHDFPTGLEFDIQLNRVSQVMLPEALERLQRNILNHDRPEIEHLLVTAGGPDRQGYCYPGEEQVAQFVLEHIREVRAKCLSGLWIHLWRSKRIAKIPIVRDEP